MSPTNNTEASIQLPNGKIFVCHLCHGDALGKASTAGYADSILEKAELGFSDKDGTSFEHAGATIIFEDA
jgi:hypothetical protein